MFVFKFLSFKPDIWISLLFKRRSSPSVQLQFMSCDFQGGGHVLDLGFGEDASRVGKVQGFGEKKGNGSP